MYIPVISYPLKVLLIANPLNFEIHCSHFAWYMSIRTGGRKLV